MSKQPLDFAGLFPEADLIEDRGLRREVEAIWQDLWQRGPWTDIEAMPTSYDMPYSHVRHNRSVLKMALAVADVLEDLHSSRIDRDVLVAAALLQDVSKLLEMQPVDGGPADGVERTRIGELYPHAFWGAHEALVRGLPDEVAHIVLTHTPQAAQFPKTLEGLILYYVDQIDVAAIHGGAWVKRLYSTLAR